MEVHLDMKVAHLGNPCILEWAVLGGTAWMTSCLWQPCATTEIPGETGSVRCAVRLQACNATPSRVHFLVERP